MCGISGIFDKKNLIKNRGEYITKMNRAQKHRGPDDDGIFEAGSAALGHVRLSILDLSAAGHQPMSLKDRYTIVYNGEVFNYIELREELKAAGYTFATGTDTEVLLAAYDMWGADCQRRFNGFWAFAVYDSLNDSLFLSRDRYGVKPLYYSELSGCLTFASEIKALLAGPDIPRIANDQAIVNYLINGFVDCEDETCFKGVFRLPAGCQAETDRSGKINLTRWYELPYKETICEKLTSGDMSTFRALFEDSVKMRLRSDVPVGSCLSGGLDSSSIVCESARQLNELKTQSSQSTYSAIYPKSPDDEKRYIDSVTEKAGVTSHFVLPDGEALFEDLDRLIYTQDEPFVSTSMYASYRVMKLAHQHGAKVLLDGQGADEILCGYRKARVYYIKKLLSAGRPFSAIKEAILYAPYMRKNNSTFLSDLNMLKQFLGRGTGGVKREYLAAPVKDTKLSRSYKNSDSFIVDDFSSIVLPALLRYVDRNSMAFSIEDRLPFLDYRLVEFSMKLPLSAKIHNGWSKYIMRKTLDMPEPVRKRRDKIGFYTPEKDWLKAHSAEYRRVFEAGDFRAEKYIDRKKIADNWDGLVENDDIGLFRYICLEKWMRAFDVRAE